MRLIKRTTLITYPPISTLALILGIVAAPVLRADVVGHWQLSGTLTITASAKGKSAKISHKNLDKLSVLLTQDQQCQLTSEVFKLDGAWSSSKKGAFTATLTPMAVRPLLKGIQDDLLAKSAVELLIEDPESVTLSGGEQKKSGKLKGKLQIKARTLFSGFDSTPGRLTVTYDFLGTRSLKAVAQVAP